MAFLQSSHDVDFIRPSILKATCQNSSGTANLPSFFDLNLCLGNNEGSFALGSGGFSQSCGSVTYNDGVLTAELRTSAGNIQTNSINLNECIANIDGNLECRIGDTTLAVGVHEDPTGPFASYLKDADDIAGQTASLDTVISSFGSRMQGLDNDLHKSVRALLSTLIPSLDKLGKDTLALSAIESASQDPENTGAAVALSSAVQSAGKDTLALSAIESASQDPENTGAAVALSSAVQSAGEVIKILDTFLKDIDQTTKSMGDLETEVMHQRGLVEQLADRCNTSRATMDTLLKQAQQALENSQQVIAEAERMQRETQANIDNVKNQPGYDTVETFWGIPVFKQAVSFLDNDAAQMIDKLNAMMAEAENQIRDARASALVQKMSQSLYRVQIESASSLSRRFESLSTHFSELAHNLELSRAKLAASVDGALKIRHALGLVDNMASVVKYDYTAHDIAASVLEMRETVGANDELSAEWKDHSDQLAVGLKVVAAKVANNAGFEYA